MARPTKLDQILGRVPQSCYAITLDSPFRDVFMDQDLACKVEDFRTAAAKAAEDIVFKRFPTKVCQMLHVFGGINSGFYALNFGRELHQLVQTTSTKDSPFHLSHAETFTDATVYPPPGELSTNGPAQKKRKRDDDAPANDVTLHSNIQHAKIPSLMVANRHMSQKVHDVVKKECAEMAGMIDELKLWVTLTMPKIEEYVLCVIDDSDFYSYVSSDYPAVTTLVRYKKVFMPLFGVLAASADDACLPEVLAELHRAQESAYNLRDAPRQDYLARAELCSKILKYPNIEDYTIRAPKANNSVGLY
ncbi:hypothetical protein C0995_004248 [Termitomyces sp. Mi166|nr:hypothetical protein C0995_004248 [Termitomyces sp. Mi166\